MNCKLFGRANRNIDDKLFLACQDGIEYLFDQAMEGGANPNACDVFSRRRPIHVAVSNGKTTIVRKLLSNPNVKLDLVDAGSRTPLELARTKGYQEIEALLVAYTLEPNKASKVSNQKTTKMSSSLS